ncbi:MAG: hypothetical protein ACUVTZ_04060 [Armatimonadota bacterium]
MSQAVSTFHYAALVKQIEEALISLWDDPVWQDAKPESEPLCNKVTPDAESDLAVDAVA